MNEMPRILIVDDEPSARQTMEMLLYKEGYEMVFAANGPEALASLEVMPPDVIMLDVMMPGMDGFEVCRTVKQDDKLSHIPIILVTALDSKRDLARGLDAGADDFLHKPYNSLELRARVRSMLRIKRRHDDLEAALQLRDDLSNMIVHDIRGPLSSILIYCDLLEINVEGAHGLDHLGVIRNEANRLSSSLNDMLMMAKMENNRLVLSTSLVDVAELIEDALKIYEPMATLKGLDMVVEMPPVSHAFMLDGSLWRRVVDNLISNAVKFSPANGRILFQLSYPQLDADDATPQLCLRVIDEGPGIPDEYQHSIFDKFEIVASGRRDVKQVGLGLAFCKMVLDAHNGRIFVTPNQPRGSIFTIEL